MTKQELDKLEADYEEAYKRYTDAVDWCIALNAEMQRASSGERNERANHKNE